MEQVKLEEDDVHEIAHIFAECQMHMAGAYTVNAAFAVFLSFAEAAGQLVEEGETPTLEFVNNVFKEFMQILREFTEGNHKTIEDALQVRKQKQKDQIEIYTAKIAEINRDGEKHELSGLTFMLKKLVVAQKEILMLLEQWDEEGIPTRSHVR